MSEPGTVYLVSGPPGAGKSTVAQALVQRFPFGMHLPVDDLREWVVSGIAHPVPTWTDETTRQFSLARQAACGVARLYAHAARGYVIVPNEETREASEDEAIAAVRERLDDLMRYAELLHVDEATLRQLCDEALANYEPLRALLVDWPVGPESK